MQKQHLLWEGQPWAAALLLIHLGFFPVAGWCQTWLSNADHSLQEEETVGAVNGERLIIVRPHQRKPWHCRAHGRHTQFWWAWGQNSTVAFIFTFITLSDDFSSSIGLISRPSSSLFARILTFVIWKKKKPHKKLHVLRQLGSLSYFFSIYAKWQIK